MELKITKEEKSALPRKEIECVVTYEGVTPSRAQLVQSISSKTKAKNTLIIVKNIYTTYGDKTAKINAYIYDNEEAMNAIEYAKMVEKNKPKAPEPKAEETKEDSVPSSDSQDADNKEGDQ